MVLGDAYYPLRVDEPDVARVATQEADVVRAGPKRSISEGRASVRLIPPAVVRSIEVPVCGLHECARLWKKAVSAIGTIRLGAPVIDRRQRTVGRDLEDGSRPIVPSALCYSVKVAVFCEHQGAGWGRAVQAIRLGAEVVEDGQLASGGDFEECATGASRTKAVCVRSAVVGRPIQVGILPSD